jgi:hypothetical protein
MDTIVRNIRDIDQADRSVLEHVLGQPLAETQQIVVQVVDAPSATAPANGNPAIPVKAEDEATQPTVLPDWCNVYKGLSETEIDEIEKIALQRADLSRDSE